ncbi:hypothetical protein OSB04_002305 [Centaurea solstitialis]|uniref:No apical meristem-associated C-terminal domain-containing protein n=1 Tax=Centaurea solstitialis TaxID=347529 RepID=A0AA38TT40_9ASTR|nr:hypothetical protein OSB04_002305 [Centaurea solstitialis]
MSGRGSRGRASRGGGGSRGAGPSRGVGGSRGAGPSGGAGGSGFGGGSGFADYANHEPYIPQFDAQQQPAFIPHYDEQNAGYGTGRTRSFPRKTETNLPTRAAAKKWTHEEEVALCHSWINESENPASGNAQRSLKFWRSIERSFYTRLEATPYRTHHQLTAKWRAMNKKIMAFNGIYNQIMNNRPSRQNDVNLLKKVRSQYQMTEGGVFPFEECWEIVRHSPKWAAVPLMSGGSSSRSTKRTRTSGSSDGHFGQESDEVEVPPPKRPVGRGKAKKALRGGQSSTPTTDLYDSWDRNLEEKMDYKMQKLELDRKIAELEEKKLQLQLDAAFEEAWVFCKTPHDHLEGLELQAVLQKKAVLKARHGFDF